MSKIVGLTEEEKAVLRRAVDKDLKLFAVVFMPHIVSDVPDYQSQLYQALDFNYKMLACAIFRGSAKSTISKPIQVTRDLCVSRHPYTMLISESEDQASADLVNIKEEIETNENILEVFGSLKGLISNTEALETSTGCYVRIKGVKGRARGYKWKNRRPSKIILDDFESEHNTETAELRRRTQEWIWRVVKFMGDPSTVVQFFNTIVHPESFMARAKKSSFFKEPYGRYMEIPAMYKDENGNWISNWESRFPVKTLLKERASFFDEGQGPSWDQEMLNIPAVLGEKEFETNRMVEIDATFDKYLHITWIKSGSKVVPVNVFNGFDPAATVKESSDETCSVTIAVPPVTSKDGMIDIIIVDIDVDKIRITNQPDLLFKTKEAYEFIHSTIETQGYQLALAENIRTMIGNGRQPAFAIKEFSSQESKKNKFIKGLVPFVNGGHVSYLKGCKHIERLKEQMSDFNSGILRTKDDILDGLYLSIINAYSPIFYNVMDVVEEIKRKKPAVSKLSWIEI